MNLLSRLVGRRQLMTDGRYELAATYRIYEELEGLTEDEAIRALKHVCAILEQRKTEREAIEDQR